MVDPVTVSIAVAGRVIPAAITGVRDGYKGWKEMRSFGKDYGVMWRDYSILVSRMEALAARKLGWLERDFDPNDENDPVTDAILKQLTNLEIHFRNCRNIMEKYPDTEFVISNEHEDSAPEEPEGSRGRDSENVPEIIIYSTKNAAEGDGVRSAGIEKSLTLRPQSRRSSRVSPGAASSKGSLDVDRGSELSEDGSASLTAPKRKKKGRSLSRMLNPFRVFRRKEFGELKPPKTAISMESSKSTVSKPDLDQSMTLSVSQSGHTSQTSFTAPQASIFDTKTGQALIKAGDEQANKLQKDTSVFRTGYSWVPKDEDKDTFQRERDEIKKGLDSLEELLKYRQPRNRSYILADIDASSITRNGANARRALKRLDDALASRALAGKPLLITVKLTMDCRRDFRNLERQESNIEFRPDVFAFILKVHRGDVSSTATEVFAEVTETINTNPLQIDYLPQISDLSTSINAVVPDEQNDWQLAGSIWKPGNRNDVHRLFVHTSKVYSSERDLQKLLQDASLAHLKPLLRSKLAILLAYSHLYFSEVKRSHPQYIIRPANFVYYQAHESGNWDEVSKYLFGPYISLGFGEKPPRIEVGEESGVIEEKRNPLAELGLLLFQIASGEPVDYGQDGLEGLTKARTKALVRLHQVEKTWGAEFTEIVEMCLLSKDRIDLDDRLEEEDALVGKIIKWFGDFQEILEQRSVDIEEI
jgi:hypothetical protein